MNLKPNPAVLPLYIKALGLCACIGYVGAVGAESPKPDQLFEKISPSIWIVTTFDGAERRMAQGSAVVIGTGTLVTNCHVLAKAKSFVIKQDNVIYGANLAYADAERDLCQIQVKNFTAPSVEMAATTQLRVGQKVYAIGNPRGLELSFSDGMISGLRKSDDEKMVVRVQTTAPISPGSSGGGLFDERGRLVGITSSGLKDSQNLNFAIPADWIKEIPARAKEALAKRSDPDNGVVTVTPVTLRKGPYHIGQTWTYAIVDRMTQAKQSVALQVERFNEDDVIFNRGRRIENPYGRITGAEARLLSELDALNATGGWVRPDSASTRMRSIDAMGNNGERLELQSVFAGDSKLTTPAGEFDVQVFRFTGFRRSTQLLGAHLASPVPYEATAWYAPAINRIVKFAIISPGSPKTKGALISINAIDEEIVLEQYDQ